MQAPSSPILLIQKDFLWGFLRVCPLLSQVCLSLEPRIKRISRIKSHNYFRRSIFEAMFHNDNAAFCEMRPQDIDHEFLTAQNLRM